jgi:hypothetical protein
MSHTADQGRGAVSFPPETARRIRFIAESPRCFGVGTRDSEPASAVTDRSTATGAGAIGFTESCAAATFGAGAVTMARGSSAGANPDDAGAEGVAGTAVPRTGAGVRDGALARVATGAGVVGFATGSATESARGIEGLSAVTGTGLSADVNVDRAA